MDIQMPNKMDMKTEIRALETSSRTPIIAVTAGILAGEKINVLNQEWMIIWLSQL
jgi:CheY-like chemotaxis protein